MVDQMKKGFFVVLTAFSWQRRDILIYVFLSFCFSKALCDVFVAKKHGNGGYVCVTNTSFALSWVDADMRNTLEKVSRYIPNAIHSSFDRDLTDDEQTRRYFLKKPWSLKNSLDSDINDIILDRRWENFETIQTGPKGSKYEMVKFPLDSDFAVPLSVRGEEAHIFLCDGLSPAQHNCYRIILQGSNGTASALHKCSKEMVPPIVEEEPSCDTLSRIEHSSFKNGKPDGIFEVPTYISNKLWSHFKITRNGNQLILMNRTGGGILRWNDEVLREKINATHMFLHSKMVDVFWKIHRFDYIYTIDEMAKIAFGPPLQAAEESICISMFVAMCQYCKLILTLTHYNGTFKNSTTYMNPDWGWSEITFLAENITEGNYVLSVSTIGSSPRRFWAIDRVRQCQKKEYRMISSNEKTTCQLMSADDNLISFDDANLTISDERRCSESTIGPFCVPCGWIYDDCDRITICSRNKCYCSAGYQNDECFHACPRAVKRYGHGCTKNCLSTCFGGYCHYHDGTCESCAPYYAGSTCETFTGIHVLVAPRVVNINYTGASVFMGDFQVYKVVNDDEPWTYTFQYKEADARDSKWMNASGRIKFPKNESVEIGDLTLRTTYLVRCIVSTIKNVTYVGDRVPVVKFTTKCQALSKDNVEVKTSNTTANISLIRTNRSTCTFKNYSLRTVPKVPLNPVSDDNIFFLEHLTPYTKYAVILENDSQIFKEIQTQEGVPEPVSNVQILESTTSNVKLQWDTPLSFYGIFKHYIVEYQQISYIACDTKASNLPLQHKISLKLNVTVDGLTPFAEYLFWVSSVNTANLQGPKRTITAYTLSSGVIEDEEIPQSIITPDINKVRVNFTKPDCTKVRGSPLSAKMTVRCTSEWCTPSNWTRDWQLLNHYSVVSDLIPFSDYTLSLQFCRNDSLCTNATRNKFRTKSTVPHTVSDLLVYSKNEGSISLRWKPPYPPTGLLASYKVEYDCKTCQTTKEIFDKSSCNLWPDFHCVKVTALFKDEEYNLLVYARNKDPDEFGRPRQITATTRTEPPEAPSDLRISWNTKNDLELQWKHPNRSNGDIRYFRMDIKPLSQRSANDTVVSTNLVHVVDYKYNLTYYHKVPSEVIIPSTLYNISVFADNGILGEKVTGIDSSPPEVPYFDQNPHFKSTNETAMHIRLKKPRWIERSNYTVFLLISDRCDGIENTNITLYPELQDFNLKDLRVVSTRKVINFENEVALIIGKDTKNLLLTPGISCNITVMVINTFLNKSRHSVFSDILSDKTNSLDFVKLLPWSALLVVVPIAIILFVKRHQLARFFKKQKNPKDGMLPLVDINVDHEGLNLSTISETVTSETDLNVLSKLIKLVHLKTYVKESLANGEFENQHQIILNKSADYVYETVEGRQYFDYVDMEYTDGLTIGKAYIATEVPKIHAIADFWKTIWEENVEHIVLLGDCLNGKFTKYWPTKQNSMKCHKISVQVAYSQVSPNCVHRTFILIYRKQIKQVDQIHFSYSGLNTRKFVTLLKTLSSYPLKSASPICIHSSVGMGQTGLVLLCDMCIRMGKKEDAVDVLKSAKRLSTHNPAMMNNIEHYKMAHSVIVEYFFGEEADTTDSSSEYLNI